MFQIVSARTSANFPSRTIFAGWSTKYIATPCARVAIFFGIEHIKLALMAFVPNGKTIVAT